jgi:ribosomal protein S18 acetylase RimI-like enzyme
VELRSAALSDARAIAEVHVDAWRAAYADIVPDEHLRSLSVDRREASWRDAIARGVPEVWVAERDGKVAGWIAVGASRDADAAVGMGELQAIYIAPDRWSTGVGRALWEAGQRRLVEHRFTAVTVWVLEENARAIRFYRAAGFLPEMTSRKQITIGGKGLWEIRFRKTLEA